MDVVEGHLKDFPKTGNDADDFADIVSLMMARNALGSWVRRNKPLMAKEDAQSYSKLTNAGDVIYMILHHASILYSACDVLRRRGIFFKIASNAKFSKRTEWDALQRAISKTESSSLYMSILSRLRNDLFAHWPREPVKKALLQKDDVVCVFATGSGLDFRYSFADIVAMDMVAAVATDSNTTINASVLETTKQMQNFTYDFLDVADEIIKIYLDDHRCRRINKRSM